MEINKWYHVCGVYEGLGTGAVFYVNGVDKSISEQSGGPSADDDSDNILRLGASSGNEEFGNFNGYIDEVKIYPYARAADEIKADYNAGLSGMPSRHGAAVTFGSESDKWMSDGLVGYWKFDESATTSGAVDSSGNGNDGTYYGDASTTAGKFGNGGVFDGSGDYLYSSGIILPTTDFTLATWVYLDTTNDETILMGSNSGAGDELRFQVATEFKLYVNNSQYTGNTTISTGQWYHLVASRQGSDIMLYINGEKDLDEMASNGDVLEYTGCGLLFGADTDSGCNGSLGNYTDGQIDEVRIYNRALSADEVQKLYEWAPGPVAHWKFDEYTGTTTYDVSGYGNNGILGTDGIGTDLPDWTRGKFGSALSYDGNDDILRIASDSSIDDLSAATFAFWYYPKEATGDCIIVKDDNDMGTPRICPYTNQRLTFARKYSGDDLQLLCDVGSFNLNEWTHIAVAYDGPLYSNAAIYINGIECTYIGQSNGTGVLDTEAGTPIDISPANGPQEMLVDDVRIYNYARTQKQILEDMLGGKPALESPVLHLKFDEGKGATAYDSSIHANNGTLYPGTGGDNTASSAMWSLDGHSKGAMEFDGVDDYISIPSFNPHTYRDFTISVWYKSAENTTFDDQYIFWHEEINVGLVNFGITDDTNQTDKLRFNLYEPINTLNNYYGSSDIVDQKWHHLVAIRGNGRIKLYVDGENELDTPDLNAGYDIVVDDADDLAIGDDPGNTEQVEGLLDEFIIYDYALTAEEVKTVYNDSKGAVMGEVRSANNNGTTVTGKSAEYCIPGDTAVCDAPVLELKFDELAGTTTYDTSGNGNDGVFVSADTSPAWSLVGKNGSALKFDGVDDYVEVNDSSSFNYSDMTLSLWVKPDTWNSNTRLLSKRDSSGTMDWELREQNEELMLAVGETTDYLIFAQNYNPSLNIWSNVVVTKDSNDYSLYENGILIGTDSSATTWTDSDNIFIGSRDGSANYFNGLIDDVKIYDYARTPAQIAWDYNRGKPIAYWNFDECKDSTIHDNSGNGNHGTLNLGTTGVTATGTCAESASSFWYNGRSGKVNGAGSFDGGSDYIELSSFDLSSTDAVTVSFWLLTDVVTSANKMLFEYSTNAGVNNAFYINMNEGCVDGCIRIGDHGSVWNQVYTSKSYADGNWHHFVGVIDRSLGVNQNKIYVDGIIDTIQDATWDNDITISFGGPYDSYIISRAGSSEFLEGLIDEVKIWNYALTPEQVQLEYNNGAVSFGY